MSVIGFALALFFIISWSLGGILAEGVPKGWASLIVSITIFSGIQLLVLGMVGEYIGRIFLTQNKQPQFMVRSKHIHSPGITDNEI
jgi:undecaprenyl-phosphate 4-deoxy-4-formamido-L-arabinose transferase